MIEEIVFPSVNRSLITIYMKQPYVDWINTLREKEEIEKNIIHVLEDINEEPQAYLIPEVYDLSDLELYLERYWILLFEIQLSGWMLDKKVWPKKSDLAGLIWSRFNVNLGPERGQIWHERTLKQKRSFNIFELSSWRKAKGIL